MSYSLLLYEHTSSSDLNVSLLSSFKVSSTVLSLLSSFKVSSTILSPTDEEGKYVMVLSDMIILVSALS